MEQLIYPKCRKVSRLVLHPCFAILCGAVFLHAAEFNWYSGDCQVHPMSDCNAGVPGADSIYFREAKENGLNWIGFQISRTEFLAEQESLLVGHAEHPFSEPNCVARYDLEMSTQYPSAEGHFGFIYLPQPRFVCVDRSKWLLPVVNYHYAHYVFAHEGGGIAGLYHAQTWGRLRAVDTIAYPGVLGGGYKGLSLPMDLALGVVDFIGIDKSYNGKIDYQLNAYSIWYEFLNAGFRVPLIASSDYPCASWGPHTLFAVPAGTPLSSYEFVQAVKRGQVVARTESPNSGKVDFLNLSVDGHELGSKLVVPSTKINLDIGIEYSLCNPGKLPLRTMYLVVNGMFADSFTVEASSEKKTMRFSLPLSQSCWIALRTERAHTSPIYVYRDGLPIRAITAFRARGWKNYVQKYQQTYLKTHGSNHPVILLADSAMKVWETIAREIEGTVVPTVVKKDDFSSFPGKSNRMSSGVRRAVFLNGEIRLKNRAVIVGADGSVHSLSGMLLRKARR